MPTSPPIPSSNTQNYSKDRRARWLLSTLRFLFLFWEKSKGKRWFGVEGGWLFDVAGVGAAFYYLGSTIGSRSRVEWWVNIWGKSDDLGRAQLGQWRDASIEEVGGSAAVVVVVVESGVDVGVSAIVYYWCCLWPCDRCLDFQVELFRDTTAATHRQQAFWCASFHTTIITYTWRIGSTARIIRKNVRVSFNNMRAIGSGVSWGTCWADGFPCYPGSRCRIWSDTVFGVENDSTSIGANVVGPLP